MPVMDAIVVIFLARSYRYRIWKIGCDNLLRMIGNDGPQDKHCWWHCAQMMFAVLLMMTMIPAMLAAIPFHHFFYVAEGRSAAQLRFHRAGRDGAVGPSGR